MVPPPIPKRRDAEKVKYSHIASRVVNESRIIISGEIVSLALFTTNAYRENTTNAGTFHDVYLGSMANGRKIAVKVLMPAVDHDHCLDYQTRLFGNGYDMYEYLQSIKFPVVKVLSSREQTMNNRLWITEQCHAWKPTVEEQRTAGKALFSHLFACWAGGTIQLPDLKPDNVMKNHEENLVMIDFGEEVRGETEIGADLTCLIQHWDFIDEDMSEMATILKEALKNSPSTVKTNAIQFSWNYKFPHHPV